jgi:hypothetical protein
MKKTITVCNKCGEEIKDFGFDFQLFKERKSNGTENENWYWQSDLCNSCIKGLTKKLLKFFENVADKNSQENLAKEYRAVEI